MSDPLEAVVDEIARAPHSAASLTLYALVSTLDQERAGCLFKLDKLRDLDPGQRRLAWELVELMVERRNAGDTWSTAKARMDALVRQGG